MSKSPPQLNPTAPSVSLSLHIHELCRGSGGRDWKSIPGPGLLSDYPAPKLSLLFKLIKTTAGLCRHCNLFPLLLSGHMTVSRSHPDSWACLHMWTSVIFKNRNESLRFCSEKNSTSHWSDFSPVKLHCSQGQKRRRQQEGTASHQFSLAGSCGRFWQNTNMSSGPVIIFTFHHNYCHLLLLKRCSIICLSLSAASGLLLSCRCGFLITLENMLSDSVTETDQDSSISALEFTNDHRFSEISVNC